MPALVTQLPSPKRRVVSNPAHLRGRDPRTGLFGGRKAAAGGGGGRGGGGGAEAAGGDESGEQEEEEEDEEDEIDVEGGDGAPEPGGRPAHLPHCSAAAQRSLPTNAPSPLNRADCLQARLPSAPHPAGRRPCPRAAGSRGWPESTFGGSSAP